MLLSFVTYILMPSSHGKDILNILAIRRTYINISLVCISIFYLLQRCLGEYIPLSHGKNGFGADKTGPSHYLLSLSCPYGTTDVSQQIVIFTRHALVCNWTQKLPHIFKKYFQQNKDVHELNTRQANDFHVPFSRLQVRSFSIKIHRSQVWNSFPTHIKISTSVMDFKKKLRK